MNNSLASKSELNVRTHLLSRADGEKMDSLLRDLLSGSNGLYRGGAHQQGSSSVNLPPLLALDHGKGSNLTCTGFSYI